MPRSPATRFITIGGGKGGVGKTLITANLGAAMARMGYRVTLVDADLGAANLHTMLGVDRPGPTIRGLLRGEIDHLGDAAVATPIEGLRLVGGVGAIAGAADLSALDKSRLLAGIASLDGDVVLVDCGAGASQLVVDLFNLGDLRLLALNPQITSIHNAYAFLKAAVYRAVRRAATTREELTMLGEAISAPESSRVADWLVKVWAQAPAFASRIVYALDHYAPRLVGNQLLDAREQASLAGVTRLVRDLLNVQAPLIGSICASRAIHDSVNKRRPFILDDVHEHGGRALVDIAEALLAEDVVALRAGRGESRDDLLAGGADVVPISMSLPRNVLSAYVRRHERQAVDWRAVIHVPGAVESVRVREVSLGGALVELTRPVALGAHGNLVFDQFEDAPDLPFEVRHVREAEGLVGVQFLIEGDLPARIVAAASQGKVPALARSA